jgi:hypothetical protein
LNNWALVSNTISISDYVCVVFPYQIMFVSYFHIRLCLCRISISDYVCVVFPYQIMCMSYFHIRLYLCRLTITRRTSLMSQELLSIPKHVNSPPIFSGVHVAQPKVVCVVFCRSFLLTIFGFYFLLVNAILSVRLRFTASDYPFGILDLQLLITLLVS